jgi:hypothetical protein
MIETVFTCPLGSTCEEVKDNKLHRCRWYTKLVGENPQTGEVTNESDCAITFLPMLLIENARTNRGQTAALESFRNEVVNQSNRIGNGH